jgi:hypothetical protein
LGERSQRKIGGKEEVDWLLPGSGGMVVGLLSMCALVGTFLKVG